VNAILKAGGLPVIIPLMTDAKTVRIILENVDGLIMTGGEDIRPHLYNEYPIEQIGAVDSIRVYTI
jgi:gamma-glutamyl-gamma-aminobutyrate hydrolase PuuD